MRRKLAAILAADVVGFSRRMGEDDVATMAAVQRLFGEVLTPCVAARGGRVFKTMGDGALAIFDSAVEAVAAAHEIQVAVLKIKNLELRIAVHAGDVLIDDEQNDTFGDGVNIAARLQAIGTARRSHRLRRGLPRGPAQAALPLREPRHRRT